VACWGSCRSTCPPKAEILRSSTLHEHEPYWRRSASALPAPRWRLTRAASKCPGRDLSNRERIGSGPWRQAFRILREHGESEFWAHAPRAEETDAWSFLIGVRLKSSHTRVAIGRGVARLLVARLVAARGEGQRCVDCEFRGIAALPERRPGSSEGCEDEQTSFVYDVRAGCRRSPNGLPDWPRGLQGGRVRSAYELGDAVTCRCSPPMLGVV